MFLSAFIASRLSLRRVSDEARRRSPGTFIAVGGIALAIAIMIIATSVVIGFKEAVRDSVTGFNAPVTIYPVEAFSENTLSQGITANDTITAAVGSAAPAAEISLVVTQSAIFKTPDDFEGVVLKGSSSPLAAEFINKNITAGVSLQEADSIPDAVVISEKTASALKLAVGDRLDVHFLRDNGLTTRKLDIVGLYNTHFSEYDGLYAFTHLDFLQKLSRVDSLTGSALELRGIPSELSPQVAAQIDALLLAQGLQHNGRRDYLVTNVIDSCPMYFNWLELLDTNVVVIIILMTLVAAFTLISSLFIIILERVNMIGLLKALGADNLAIRKIFILLAQRLVIRGLIWGNVIALALIGLQEHFHLLPLDPDSYYLDYVPVDINWLTILIINLAAVAIALLVLIIPSQFIARLSPAQSMRFE